MWCVSGLSINKINRSKIPTDAFPCWVLSPMGGLLSCSASFVQFMRVIIIISAIIFIIRILIFRQSVAVANAKRAAARRHIQTASHAELRRASILIGIDRTECRSIIIWNNSPTLLAAGMLRSLCRLSSSTDDCYVIRLRTTMAVFWEVLVPWPGVENIGLVFTLNSTADGGYWHYNV